MTPKEKAKELFTKFSANTVHYDAAKQCALIAVNEILNLSKIASLRRDYIYMELEYWEEVKQQIEKL